MKNDILFYMGIDVQIKKGCSYFIVDKNKDLVHSGWAIGNKPIETANQLRSVALETSGGNFSNFAIGIDSPRVPLKNPREFYWNGKKKKWRKRKPREKGYGRHCEVVIKSLGIANPQWTGLVENCPEWMQLGFEIYKAMKTFDSVFEVFPSASYNMLKNHQDLKVEISFANFYQGPKDMIDACVSAMTVYEFVHGRGAEVGGGDGLGTIILPRPFPGDPSPELLKWPEQSQGNPTKEPDQLKRGKLFHKKVQADWRKTAEGDVKAERVILKQSGRKGRIDVFVNDDDPDGTIAIVEIKASDWNRMTETAVRRNVRRQIQQIWDYIESQIVKGEYVPTGEQKSVCPGIIFPKRPKDKGRLELIEKLFIEEGIPVVWDDESIEECKERQNKKPVSGNGIKS